MKFIDVHTHINRWMFPIPDYDNKSLMTLMDRNNIIYSIISSGLALEYDFITGNHVLFRTIADEERLFGYAVLNPHYLEESLQELDRYSRNPKCVGVKLHPETHGYNIAGKAARKLFERIAELGLPVLVHCFGVEQVRNLAQTADLFTSVKIIMGHMGGNCWPEGIEAACGRSNIYLEPCSSYPESDKIGQAVQAIGADRMVFGTDSTLLNPAFVLGMLFDADLTEDDREKMAYRNAASLFNLAI